MKKFERNFNKYFCFKFYSMKYHFQVQKRKWPLVLFITSQGLCLLPPIKCMFFLCYSVAQTFLLWFSVAFSLNFLIFSHICFLVIEQGSFLLVPSVAHYIILLSLKELFYYFQLGGWGKEKVQNAFYIGRRGVSGNGECGLYQQTCIFCHFFPAVSVMTFLITRARI